jgi:uncharacterized membrane protein YqiK
MAGNFLEQIKRAREAAEKPVLEATEQEQTKPTEQMTDDELEEAITASKRELLDLQHAELREREIARASGAGEATGPRASGLAEVLGTLQKRKRRSWR